MNQRVVQETAMGGLFDAESWMHELGEEVSQNVNSLEWVEFTRSMQTDMSVRGEELPQVQ